MRRSAWLMIGALAVVLCGATARASSLTPEETKWALRARAVWRAYRLDWDSKAKMQKAERDLLAAGSRREATVNLRAVLRKLPPADPARYPIGFTMALLDLGYEDGREVLIHYLRHDKPYGTAVSEHSVIPDPNDDPRKADIASEWDGLAGMAYFVYQRHRDPMLVSELLDYRTDGAGAEMLAGVLYSMARDYPRGLLAGLRGKPNDVWRQAVFSLAFESRGGPRDTFLPVETAYPKLSHIARSQHDSLRKTARRLVEEVRAEQRGQGMKAE